MRKMWIGILKDRMVSVWYEHKVIDADQHAFLRGKSTAQPIYVRKFALADAKFRKRFIATTDVDLHHAYDQTERWVYWISRCSTYHTKILYLVRRCSSRKN